MQSLCFCNLCVNGGRGSEQDSRIFVSCQSGNNLENGVAIRNIVVLKKDTDYKFFSYFPFINNQVNVHALIG